VKISLYHQIRPQHQNTNLVDLRQYLLSEDQVYQTAVENVQTLVESMPFENEATHCNISNICIIILQFFPKKELHYFYSKNQTTDYYNICSLGSDRGNARYILYYVKQPAVIILLWISDCYTSL
jgi:hypothetical protein